tara:strand:+ start:142 stop:363 length:222 start_codon:yes stop_codon:yes gene_type:complete
MDLRFLFNNQSIRIDAFFYLMKRHRQYDVYFNNKLIGSGTLEEGHPAPHQREELAGFLQSLAINHIYNGLSFK